MADEVKEELKKILGDDAFSIGDMQVSDRVSKLVKSVNYLTAQLKITAKLDDDEQRKEHVRDVIKNVKEILSKEKA